MRFKIMTFNLRYDKPDPNDSAWTVRRDAIATLISHHAPDVIGTQEGKAHQLLDLHRLLPDYQSVGCDRTGNGSDEHCAIFYRTQHLDCVNTGDFWLSQTPDIPASISPEWGNPVPRMATWAIFAVVGESTNITVVNTHLDYHSASARELSGKLICDRVGSLLDRFLQSFLLSKSLLFVTGDFNDEPGSAARNTFLNPLPNGVQLLDALTDLDLQEQKSFHDFTGKAFAAVDTIYYDSRLFLGEVHLDRSQPKGIWPSDHFPAIAEFSGLRANS